MTNAPNAETISPLLEMNKFALLFAAYAAQENMTITGSCLLRYDCRLDSEEQIE